MYQSPYSNNSPYYNYQRNNGYANPYMNGGGALQPNLYPNMVQQPAIGQSQQMAQPQPQTIQQGYVTPPPSSNKILAISLEDALSKSNDPNTITIYIDQDKPLLYEIEVDLQGRKTYQIYDISLHKAEEKTKEAENKMTTDEFVPMATFSALHAQFLNLQDRFNTLVERLKTPSNAAKQSNQVKVQDDSKKE